MLSLPSLDLPGEELRGGAGRAPFLPHVVAWNLTRRCNLACAHCYISAGSWETANDELTTGECLRIADEILEMNPAPIFILSGGEPLLRADLEEIARHASSRGATVVVGTNGTRLTDARIESLRDAGVSGVAISVDSLSERYHDRFRHGTDALRDTLAAVDRLRDHRLDFIVQSSLTRGNRQELAALAEWAAEKGAVAFNLYFLVPTGRGEGMAGLSPEENEEVLEELLDLEERYRGRMMVRSKCQPALMRLAHMRASDSPLLNYRTRCPCGLQYCRITPEGKVTSCPYSPVVAGDLRSEPFRDIWAHSPVFQELRHGTLEGKCGRCEFREVCGGCRARAQAVTGNLLGPDDSCAYEPSGELEPVAPKGEALYGAPSPAPSLPWTEGARARIERVPSFVRGVVEARVESFARERGLAVVDEAVMDRVRSEMPVDFSRRLPFFLQRGGRA